MNQPEFRDGMGTAWVQAVSCIDLAIDAWGDPCSDPNSGLTAFAYLWRRFGPPRFGSDPQKDLVQYVLTTTDPDVWIGIRCSGSALKYGCSYATTEANRAAVEVENTTFDQRQSAWLVDVYGSTGVLWDRFEDEAFLRAMEAAVGCRPRLPRDWRTSPNDAHRKLNATILEAYRELLRPVFVRDVAINIFGRVHGVPGMEEAEVSPFAGYGIPPLSADNEGVNGG